MKTYPKYPRHDRDTSRLIGSLIVAAIAYAALTLGIHLVG